MKLKYKTSVKYMTIEKIEKKEKNEKVEKKWFFDPISKTVLDRVARCLSPSYLRHALLFPVVKTNP